MCRQVTQTPAGGKTITSKSTTDGAIKVLQITDTHLFENPDGCLLGLNTEQSLQAVIDDAAERHLPADLEHFRRLTWGRWLVMGRRTWQSIGRALPGRQNVVVTRDTGFHAEGCEAAGSVAAAVARRREDG